MFFNSQRPSMSLSTRTALLLSSIVLQISLQHEAVAQNKSPYCQGKNYNTFVQATRMSVPVIAHPSDARFSRLLQSSRGQLSAGLRQAFLNKQKTEVLETLAKAGRSIDGRLLAWIDADSDAADAVYGTVCPADPDILLNLNQLWREQGPAFTRKYKHLSLAASVARRGVGVGPLASFSKWIALCSSAAAARTAGEDPAKALLPRKDYTSPMLPANDADRAAFSKVTQFLKDHKLTHRQAAEDEDNYDTVRAIIKESGSQMKTSDVLRGLLIVEGKRPERRGQIPGVADYFKFLAKINDTPASSLPLQEDQRWPLFPATSALWPLMMPLTHGLPLDEARYIWEKHQGRHGERRLHTYGPFRGGKKTLYPQLEAREWHWSAYPSVIEQGGICGTMSSIAMMAYTGLGQPVLKAGQPRHSCIVAYHISTDGKFVAGV